MEKETGVKVSRRLLAAMAACVLGATGFGYLAFAAPAKDVTLQGGAVWNGNGKRADVTAVLTPTARNDYSVVYSVTWEGSRQTWKGRIKGELQNGSVVGDGATPDGKRTFIFRATAVNGVITGKHYETTGGKTKLTGDIGLKQQ